MNPFDLPLLRWFNGLVGRNPALDAGIAVLTKYAPPIFLALFALYFFWEPVQSKKMRRDLVAAHVQAFPVPPLSPDLAARVVAQLTDHPTPAIPRWAGLLPIGAALLVAVLTWALWRPLLRLWWVLRGLARGLYHLVTSGQGAAPGWNAALVLAGAVLLVGSWLAARALASSAWREETT